MKIGEMTSMKDSGRKASAVEWIAEHTEQDELFCKNILTNILEHDIIQV